MGVEAARRTLSQLADAELEQRMCDRFAERLRDLDEKQREKIARHLGDGEASAAIHTTFDLSHERQDRLRQVIRDAFGDVAEVNFEQSADLICGLELDIAGYRFGWNVEKFLHDLDLEFQERLKSAD
jgi:F-type H+-transporting ATPase subunit b